MALGALALIAGGAKIGAGILGSQAQAGALKTQANELKFQADIEEYNAKVTENDLREQLGRLLASNQAAASASGIAGGSGVLDAALYDDIGTYDRAIRARNLESRFKAGALRRGAKNLRKEARQVQGLGALNAVADLASMGNKAAGVGKA